MIQAYVQLVRLCTSQSELKDSINFIGTNKYTCFKEFIMARLVDFKFFLFYYIF
jgi:hypothetical protein